MRKKRGFRPQRGTGVSDAYKRRGYCGEPTPGCHDEMRGAGTWAQWRAERTACLPAPCLWVNEHPPGQSGVTEHPLLAGSALSYVPRLQARNKPSPSLRGFATLRKKNLSLTEEIISQCGNKRYYDASLFVKHWLCAFHYISRST